MRKPTKTRSGGREAVQKTHFKKETFDEWPLKNGETVRVGTDRDAGFDLVHIRRWQRGPTGQLHPTEKGIAIQIGHLQRLLKALKKVRAHARELGLQPEPKRQITRGSRE